MGLDGAASTLQCQFRGGGGEGVALAPFLSGQGYVSQIKELAKASQADAQPPAHFSATTGLGEGGWPSYGDQHLCLNRVGGDPRGDHLGLRERICLESEAELGRVTGWCRACVSLYVCLSVVHRGSR